MILDWDPERRITTCCTANAIVLCVVRQNHRRSGECLVNGMAVMDQYFINEPRLPDRVTP